MNRQLRRAQAKQDKKAEFEKQKKKDARRDRIEMLKERRAKRREAAKRSGAEDKRVSNKEAGAPVSVANMSAEQRKKLPGRFSGAFMIATVFFIVLQGVAPDPEAGVVGSLTGAGFFLLYGYFSALNLERRGMANSLTFTMISGVALAGGVTAARYLAPGTSPDWLMTGVGVVGVWIGAYLGRMVFNAARR